MNAENPIPRPEPERYLVAFSFAGEQRELVRQIAEATEQLLGRGTVFFDEWFEGQLAGTARDLKLQAVYLLKSEVVVVCASADYAAKPWTLVEWDSIRSRHMKLRAAGNGESDRLFPLRVADGDVEGLLDNTIWNEARRGPPSDIANSILQRVRKFVPEAGKLCVFLAETSGDLDDEKLPVNRPKLRRFLESECDCAVAPADSLLDLDAGDYPCKLEAQLARSQAFVQLLSENPWKPGSYDRRQFRMSAECQLPQFCYLGDTDVAAVRNEDQRTFLSDCITKGNVITRQFEDFKQHLREKLKQLAAARQTAIRQCQEAERRRRSGSESSSDERDLPVVRVAVRAADANAVFEPVFESLNGRVLLDEIGKSDLLTKQAVEPCHGFLILCDDKAQSDEAFSPRDDLAKCRLIQTEQKKRGLPVPPVAVVFRAPPDPVWSRLLRSMPTIGCFSVAPSRRTSC